MWSGSRCREGGSPYHDPIQTLTCSLDTTTTKNKPPGTQREIGNLKGERKRREEIKKRGREQKHRRNSVMDRKREKFGKSRIERKNRDSMEERE